MTKWARFKKLIPKEPDWSIDWDGICNSLLGFYMEKMKDTHQNPVWHGEDDVFTHTKMVCQALIADEEYRILERTRQEILFIAALLHDIGKTVCTKIEDGEIRSSNHAVKGSQMVRALLWTDFEMCGSVIAQNIRECICALVRYHGFPVNFLKDADYERRLIDIASYGELDNLFSLKLLEILARADIKGRIANDTEKQLENLKLFNIAANESEIYNRSYSFKSEITKHEYLNGKNVSKALDLYDDTWKEVIIVCGLPGTGKDTWLRKNYPNLPMISLDNIRKELKILPTDKNGQGKVAAAAFDRAKEYLRNKQAFIWNSTNVTKEMRQKCINLFIEYGAYTHIVYLETNLLTELQRNQNRKEFVPEGVIYKLLKKTELPSVKEAHRVEWIIV